MGAVAFIDLAISFGINFAITCLFLFLYSLFSVQPLNARVYFTTWFMLDEKKAQQQYEKGGTTKFVYSWRSYLHSLDWVLVALQLPERELLQHAGLDMVVYLRMFKLGFKIFVPAMILSCAVLLPVYYTTGFLQTVQTQLSKTTVDFLTISNLGPGSPRYWVPCAMAWIFNLWALWVMRVEYEAVAQLRLDYLSDQKRSPQQFSVLVRQVPHDPTRTVAQQTAQFFSVVHKDHYLMTTPVFDARKLSHLEMDKEWTENKLTALQIRMERKGTRPIQKAGGCLGMGGKTVDAIEHYEKKLEGLNKKIREERDRIVNDKSCIMPASFVSFKSRWGAAVAAQTQQCKDNTKWIVTWAPEPRDVSWSNLPINYLSLTTRKFLAAVIVTGTILFYTIPIAFVQGLANLNNLAKLFPFLTPILNMPLINSFLTSFLPGLALMMFLAVLPLFLRILSTLEGYVSKSQIERAAAGKMFYFILFSVFFSNVIVGSAWGQLAYYVQHPAELPIALGTAITASSNFFITFTMLNAWSGLSTEVVRLMSLLFFHIKNSLLVRTPQERIKAMSSQGPDYVALLPSIELYFLLSYMFWILAPLYLPFAVVFFMFGYVVYRNQFINVYSAEYELGGGYWPHFHSRAIASMVMAQAVLISVFSLRYVIGPTICLLPLPLVTLLFNHTFITAAFKPTFKRLALEEAMRKDTIDAVAHPDEDPKAYLGRAYLHPSLIAAFELEDSEEGGVKPKAPPVPTVQEAAAITEGVPSEPLLMPAQSPRPSASSPTPLYDSPVGSLDKKGLLKRQTTPSHR